MKKHILYAIIILAVSAAGIFIVLKNTGYNTVEIYNKFEKCKIESDCILVKTGWCQSVLSINKKHEKKWKEFDAENYEKAKKNRQTCKVSTKEMGDLRNYSAVCSNSKCQADYNPPDSIIQDIITDDNGNIVIENIYYPEEYKGLLTKLNITDDQMTVLSKPKIVGGYPNFFPGSYSYAARIISADGEVLGEYGFSDPRFVYAEQGYRGPSKRDNLDFTLIIPYFKDGSKLNIISGSKLMLSVDITN
jgi:hypothetical protein